MCLGLCTLSDENVRKVLADPPLIWKVIAPADPEAYENARNEAPAGFLSKLFGKGKTPEPPRVEFSLADGEVADSDLDKAWHGIHYLLTQTAWEGDEPLNFLISGGSTVGEIDVGYGPARVFSADEVKAIFAALGPLDREVLRARFNPEEMMNLEIYPAIWDRDPADDDTFGYCAEYFESLKTFVEQTASRNLGLVVYLT
ncbi:YfbM family protein [Steroidobacter flavus]|uniref:YfbM family protein n=1 Tax=Steroidobacter flavus TaxID=1842136 RepID=A0ABV8SSL9_9GAMM